MKLDPSAFVAQQALIETLGNLATPISTEEDCVLFEQGEEPTGLYILHSGNAVLTMKAPNGANVLREAAANGSLFGLPGVVGGMPYSLSVTVQKGAKVSFIPRDQFSQIMMTEPALAVQVLQVLAAEVRSARSGMVSC